MASVVSAGFPNGNWIGYRATNCPLRFAWGTRQPFSCRSIFTARSSMLYITHAAALGQHLAEARSRDVGNAKTCFTVNIFQDNGLGGVRSRHSDSRTLRRG